MTQQKPREFWINVDDGVGCTMVYCENPNEEHFVRLIEYTAVEQLEQRAKEANDKANFDHSFYLQERDAWKIERVKLESKLAAQEQEISLQKKAQEPQSVESISIKRMRDEIDRLKAKLLTFEGMTFSENEKIQSLQEKLKLAKEALKKCDLNHLVDSDFLQSIMRRSDAHTRSDKNLAKILLIVREALKQLESES